MVGLSLGRTTAAMGSSLSSWLKRLSLPAYAAIGAALLLVAFVVFFVLTHCQWYDGMQTKEQVSFWTEFGVSFGTIALALVTWASVYATQQVLRGEDTRFRQSRMPMVRMHAPFSALNSRLPAYWLQEGSAVLFSVINTGDGPAIKVHAQFNLRIQYGRVIKDQTGSPSVDASEPIIATTKEDVDISSFLESKVTITARVVVEFPSETDRILQVIFEELRILYTDAFGASYMTLYEDHFRRPMDFSLMLPK